MDILAAAGLFGFGALGGALFAWLSTRTQVAQADARSLQAHAALQVEAAQLKERVRLNDREREAMQEQLAQLRRQVEDWRDALDATRDECAQLGERAARMPQLESDLARLTQQLLQAQADRADLQARLEAERENNAEKLSLLQQAKDVMSDQFKNLANDILEEKSKRFAEQNQHSLGQLLEPLKSRLVAFQGKVEEVYVQEGKDRSALAEQVRQLLDLNQTLSTDAQNLTQALKGSSKTQGHWGELILERVLEASGLRRGEEYLVQHSRFREDGTRAQPDVVIHLPQERRLVIDAKVSLVAYERAASATTDEARTIAQRQHLESVRAHIRGLSEKKYEALYDLKSLDFVLMFVPIEPAFTMAVTHDGDLFMEAWQRNVLMVSPSTLLFVVRTVAHLWRQEAQSRNAQDIAKRGAELYDKLCSFVDDLQGVGQRLGQAQASFEAAHRKLAGGRGNLIRQAEMLRELGVKPSKSLPAGLVEAATLQDELFIPGSGLHPTPQPASPLNPARPPGNLSHTAPTSAAHGP